jgi:hypothetical protein
MVDGLHSKSSYGLPEDALETALLDLLPSLLTPEQITREHHEVADFVVCD